MQPEPAEIHAQLERILASPQFAGSVRLGRFLRYVVERALAGEAQRLKEYTIGVEVFDRGKDYDPRVDSIVRVEAGRLRGKLEEYYRAADAGNGVRILLAKGSYAPRFEQQAAIVDVPPADLAHLRRWTAAAAVVVIRHRGMESSAGCASGLSGCSNRRAALRTLGVERRRRLPWRTPGRRRGCGAGA